MTSQLTKVLTQHDKQITAASLEMKEIYAAN